MRWFWVLVGLLGAGACVVVLSDGGAHEELSIEPGVVYEQAERVAEPMDTTVATERVEERPIWESVVEGADGTGGAGRADETVDREEEGELEIEVMGDGSLMLAGRYRVTGRGTPEEPYTLTWELLKSAEEGYAPILGWMYVRIDGFMMNPSLEAEVDEFLLMKNSWDACCLGLPPTPYDSMEVALDAPAEMPELQHARASVVGRLSVQPSLYAGHFLTGLYTLDDARAEFRAGL
jgi:hypothetical protein